MLEITYWELLIVISIVWVIMRVLIGIIPRSTNDDGVYMYHRDRKNCELPMASC